jgi:TonB family protein
MSMKRLVLAAVAAALAFAGVAAAKQPPRVFGGHTWLSYPTGSDVVSEYPERAARNGISGEAVVVCTVGPKGEMQDCHIQSESPKNEDFGYATLKLARRYVVATTDDSGASIVGTEVSIPAKFWTPR